MFYIVESEENLKRLESVGDCGCFLEIVTSNDNFHPNLTELVAVYIRPFVGNEENSITGDIVSEEKGYIIPISHGEGINVSKDRVEQVLQRFSRIYILNKKEGLYHFRLGKNVWDLGLLVSMTKFQRISVVPKTTTYNWYYNQYGGLPNINRVIPISKIYEKCEEDFKQIKKYILDEEPAGFQFYNEIATKVFFLVEQSGLRVDVHGFLERFKPSNPDFSIRGEIVYTNYNMYNVTSRPTNSFNSVNFLAIPKGKEFRQVFKPQNSKFVEVDFDGYHIRIVSKLVDYKLTVDEKAHKQVVRLYQPECEQMTAEQYNKAKASNFQMIYGSPSEECSELELSRRIQDFISDLWKEFKQKGYIENGESQKRFLKSELEEMYPQKLFNYLIQSLETSRNVKVLYKLLRRLQSYKTKVVLITYDSFLIDWDDSEEDVLDIVKEIMEEEQGCRTFPVSMNYSDNLCF